MPNEKQSSLKFCQTLQVRLKKSEMKGVHLPVTLRWPGCDSGEPLDLSKDFLTAPKTSSAFGNAHCKAYLTKDGNWLDMATTDVKPWSSSRPRSWTWGQVAEGQQPGWLSCICMFGSFGHSCFPSAKQGTISAGIKYSGWRWESLLRNPASKPLLRQGGNRTTNL